MTPPPPFEDSWGRMSIGTEAGSRGSQRASSFATSSPTVCASLFTGFCVSFRRLSESEVSRELLLLPWLPLPLPLLLVILPCSFPIYSSPLCVPPPGLHAFSWPRSEYQRDVVLLVPIVLVSFRCRSTQF